MQRYLSEHLPTFVVVGAALLTFVLLLLLKRYQKTEREDIEKQQMKLFAQQLEQKERALQQERGKRLWQTVTEAAKNRTGDVFQASHRRIKDNSGAYSVIVQKCDPDGTEVGCAMQFDVYPDRLHYFLNFNVSGDMPLSEFEEFLELARSSVLKIS